MCVVLVQLCIPRRPTEYISVHTQDVSCIKIPSMETHKNSIEEIDLHPLPATEIHRVIFNAISLGTGKYGWICETEGADSWKALL